jgi:nucleotide-binding universal stress UspA family protein
MMGAMDEDTRPVVVAFDGSAEAQVAVREAARLFRGRPLLVVTVWEPGLAMVMMSRPDAMGVTIPPPGPEEIAAVDRLQREHAESIAAAGVELARDLGASAEALPVPDETDVADVLAGLGDAHNAAALVVGSRGHGAVKSRVLGSTSRRLLHDTRRPLLVVRAPEGD